MRNELSCHVVADYFLVHVDAQAGDTISNLKLQKLCYYAQAWSLALTGHPLFGDGIEAWAHGPAIPALWRRFKKYGSDAIDPYDIVTDPINDLHTEHKQLIYGVWLRYGKLTGTQLRNLTHREPPWIEARGNIPAEELCQNEISQETMKAYYRQLLEEEQRDADTRAKAARVSN